MCIIWLNQSKVIEIAKSSTQRSRSAVVFACVYDNAQQPTINVYIGITLDEAIHIFHLGCTIQSCDSVNVLPERCQWLRMYTTVWYARRQSPAPLMIAISKRLSDDWGESSRQAFLRGHELNEKLTQRLPAHCRPNLVRSRTTRPMKLDRCSGATPVQEEILGKDVRASYKRDLNPVVLSRKCSLKKKEPASWCCKREQPRISTDAEIGLLCQYRFSPDRFLHSVVLGRPSASFWWCKRAKLCLYTRRSGNALYCSNDSDSIWLY